MGSIEKPVVLDLYLDANTWLSFCHYAQDDLEELLKLAALVEVEKIRLHLPNQTYNEYKINRDIKFAETIKTFTEENLAEKFPQLCGEYKSESDELRRLIKEYKAAKKLLLENMTKDFAGENFKADLVIKRLFASANRIQDSSSLLERARIRSMRGNPPGKKGAFGDAINWECLLDSVTNGRDLYFISEDVDYRSAVGKDQFSPFLMEEWVRSKGAGIVFYRRLSDFLKAHFPEIKLAEESRKELLIQALANSGSFASTRKLLRRLSNTRDLTSEQINDFAKVIISNYHI